MSCELVVNNLTILWVISDATFHKYYSVWMKQVLGKEIRNEIVSSGLEAITCARNKFYDFIIMQNPLPDVSVQFTISTIRYFEFFDSKYTPIILLCRRNKKSHLVDNLYLLEQAEIILFESGRSKPTRLHLQELIHKSVVIL